MTEKEYKDMIEACDGLSLDEICESDDNMAAVWILHYAAEQANHFDVVRAAAACAGLEIERRRREKWHLDRLSAGQGAIDAALRYADDPTEKNLEAAGDAAVIANRFLMDACAAAARSCYAQYVRSYAPDAARYLLPRDRTNAAVLVRAALVDAGVRQHA